MDHEGDTTRPGSLTFDRGVMFKTNCRPAVVPVSESCRYPRGKTSSDPNKNPIGSSTILLLEDSFKRLAHTPRLGESHPTRVPNRETQHDI